MRRIARIRIVRKMRTGQLKGPVRKVRKIGDPSIGRAACHCGAGRAGGQQHEISVSRDGSIAASCACDRPVNGGEVGLGWFGAPPKVGAGRTE
jgi:hypothetical protein